MTFFLGVKSGSSDAYNICIKIDIFPLQSKEFTTPEATIYSKC
ncbi:hypothetical protein SAMN05216469_12819 [Ruminococcus albus]|uniref:Uncharacterized protein n=1 Tax=Ruminococcus albus TaxID=1264 RepID=A0A1H7Q2W1_RUMAL|nr:hypothetical protein SAMN05216469_12819 [Ruminococcus albus]